MKSIIFFVSLMLVVTMASAQQPITITGKTGKATTKDSFVAGTIAITGGVVADSIIRTDSTVQLIFKRFDMTLEMTKESYVAYLDFLIKQKEKRLKEMANQMYVQFERWPSPSSLFEKGKFIDQIPRQFDPNVDYPRKP